MLKITGLFKILTLIAIKNNGHKKLLIDPIIIAVLFISKL